MHRLLLIDQDASHANRLALRLRGRGLTVQVVESFPEAARRLQQRIPVCDLVLISALEIPDRCISELQVLVESARQSLFTIGPLFLFSSRQKCEPQLRLRIEQLGVRYVRA